MSEGRWETLIGQNEKEGGRRIRKGEKEESIEGRECPGCRVIGNRRARGKTKQEVKGVWARKEWT